MTLFTYILDTKGGTDWTWRQTVLAKSRKEADEFMLPKVESGYYDNFVVVLDVEVREFPEGPCFWQNPTE